MKASFATKPQELLYFQDAVIVLRVLFKVEILLRHSSTLTINLLNKFSRFFFGTRDKSDEDASHTCIFFSIYVLPPSFKFISRVSLAIAAAIVIPKIFGCSTAIFSPSEARNI